MDRIWALDAATTPPPRPDTSEIGYPTDEGVATTPGAYWYHMVTEEIRNVISASGIVPSGNVLNQLSLAITQIAKKTGGAGMLPPVRVIDRIGSLGSGAQTIDGIVLVNGDRVLRAVVGTDPVGIANGIYVVNTSGVWLRAEDMLVGRALLEGTIVSVSDGNEYASTLWTLSQVPGDTATVGTTPMTYVNISGTLEAALLTFAAKHNAVITGTVTLPDYLQNGVPFLDVNKVMRTTTGLTYDGALLHVTGAIEATGGVRFPDGSQLTTASGGGAKGGGNDKLFYECDQVMTTSYAISPGKNALVAGPFTIQDGAVLTIPVGATVSVV